MDTLYDLLGIRSDADDGAIKEAFRKAVKAHHPDLHSGDPYAPLLFRQIVAANGILRDGQQRAVYDQFLQGERQRLRSKRMRAIVTDVISVAALTVALLGGYALLAPVMTTSVAVAEKDKPAVTAVAATGENNETAKVVVAVRGDAGGERVEMAALQPAAQIKAIGSEEAGREEHDAGTRERALEPRAAPAAIDYGAPEVTASREPPHEPALESALGPVSNDPKFYRERGIESYRRGDFRRAIVDLDQAIRLDANDPQAYDFRGNVLDEIGDFERALADYEEAIRIDPNSPAVFHDRAILWRRRGELDKALVDLDRAIRFSFSDANIYSDRGLVWFEKGRRDRAIADFSRAFKLDPSFAAAYINRGLMTHRSGDLGLAVADNDNAIRVDPKVLSAIQSANVRP